MSNVIKFRGQSLPTIDDGSPRNEIIRRISELDREIRGLIADTQSLIRQRDKYLYTYRKEIISEHEDNILRRENCYRKTSEFITTTKIFLSSGSAVAMMMFVGLCLSAMLPSVA